MPYDSTLLAIEPAPPPPLPDEAPKPIAHWLHTSALFGLLILSTLYTRHNAAQPDLGDAPRIPRYLASIVLEWLLLGAVIAGIYRRREFFLAAFRSRANSLLQSLGLGLVVYVLGFMAIAAAGIALYSTPLFHKRNEAAILAIAPHTVSEFVAWFGVSLTAGICEEIIFRGYLLQQLTAWTKRPIAAIVLAGMLFGCIHLYEGVAAIIPLAALGILFGFVVRHFKGDLRAVIIAHALHDFITALIALALPFLRRYQPHA